MADYEDPVFRAIYGDRIGDADVQAKLQSLHRDLAAIAGIRRDNEDWVSQFIIRHKPVHKLNEDSFIIGKHIELGEN